MRKSNQLIIFLFTIGLLMNREGYSQCKPCPPNTNPVPEEQVYTYTQNYAGNFRTSAARKKTHSLSVDFSKEAIIRFYKTNFIDITGRYSGVNVNLICLGQENVLPAQKHKDQIGLLIEPTDMNCKPVISDFNNIFNNSFDQKRGSHTETPFPMSCDATQRNRYKKNYEEIYPKININKYTTHVHFKAEVVELVYDFLISAQGANYKGIRFDFGTYGADNMACGQGDPNQITLFISPVFKDGSADLSAIISFATQKYNIKKGGISILNTFNHGQLCPSICD